MNFARLCLAIILATATATPALAEIKAANPYSERLEKLTDVQRRAAMRRAVLDSGQYCKRVDWTAKQGQYKNLVMWVARCTPGGDKAVYIGPDGSVQVRACKEAAQLKLPACKLPATGAK
jgi:hypothetical protein